MEFATSNLRPSTKRLVEIHPSGRKIVIEPFNPGLTRAEEKAKADTMAADRNAPRSGKSVAFGHDFEAAEKEALTRAVPLFINFETTWCGPCKSMDQWVYTADEVVAASSPLVAVKVDGDVRRDLVKRFGVEAYSRRMGGAADLARRRFGARDLCCIEKRQLTTACGGRRYAPPLMLSVGTTSADEPMLARSIHLMTGRTRTWRSR